MSHNLSQANENENKIFLKLFYIQGNASIYAVFNGTSLNCFKGKMLKVDGSGRNFYVEMCKRFEEFNYLT